MWQKWLLFGRHGRHKQFHLSNIANINSAKQLCTIRKSSYTKQTIWSDYMTSAVQFEKNYNFKTVQFQNEYLIGMKWILSVQQLLLQGKCDWCAGKFFFKLHAVTTLMSSWDCQWKYFEIDKFYTTTTSMPSCWREQIKYMTFQNKQI